MASYPLCFQQPMRFYRICHSPNSHLSPYLLLSSFTLLHPPIFLPPGLKHPCALPQVLCTCCSLVQRLLFNHQLPLRHRSIRMSSGGLCYLRSASFSCLLPGEWAIPNSAGIPQYFSSSLGLMNLPGWMSASALLNFLLSQRLTGFPLSPSGLCPTPPSEWVPF